MDGGPYNPRTVEEVFRDFKGRRAGLIKALTIDFEDFHRTCDTEKENLCLYGYPSQNWGVVLQGGELPPKLPVPVSGINFARDRMQENDWLSLVATHSDAWLLAVAFHYGARFGFNQADRERLFDMINDLPTVSEVVTGAKREQKEQSSVSSNSNIKSESNSKAQESDLKSQPEDKEEGLDEEDEVGRTMHPMSPEYDAVIYVRSGPMANV